MRHHTLSHTRHGLAFLWHTRKSSGFFSDTRCQHSDVRRLILIGIHRIILVLRHTSVLPYTACLCSVLPPHQNLSHSLIIPHWPQLMARQLAILPATLHVCKQSAQPSLCPVLMRRTCVSWCLLGFLSSINSYTWRPCWLLLTSIVLYMWTNLY